MSGRGFAPARSRWLPWTVLAAASVLLAGSVAVAASGLGQPNSPVAAYPSGPGGYGGQPWTGAGPDGGMMGGGMMGGRVWLPGDGTPVSTIPEARARAAEAAGASDLHPGEVMQFSENFYVELKDASGASATEVLVDPASGTVVSEYGPAMMWNSGNRNAGNQTSAMSADRATTIANQWLQANAAGQSVGSADAYPGYFTMDTVSAGKTVGMLSVNAITGAVWYHTWHGTFIAMEDA